MSRLSRTRLPLAVIWPACLVLLVGALAWLQYRWLGDVSEAERARLQSSLKQRANDFAQDFDRELLRPYSLFQIDGATLGRGDATAFAQRYDIWHDSTLAPQMVRGVYLFDPDQADASLLEYRPAERKFVPAAWPADLRSLRVPRGGGAPQAGLPDFKTTQDVRATLELLAHDPLRPSIPAIVLPLPSLGATTINGPAAFIASGQANFMALRVSTIVLIVWLDRAYLQTSFLPLLANRYFPDRGSDAYRFAVVDTANAGKPLFTRGLVEGATIDAKQADASVGLFSLRLDLSEQVAGRGPNTIVYTARGGASGTPETPAISIGGSRVDMVFTEQRTTAFARGMNAAGGMTTKIRAIGEPAWALVLQHPAGSLDAAVTGVRRRNLTVSFGMLALLAVSMTLIVVNAQRSQRLAAQQMDFVATVSHELRTPLAVIRSAAQNLSAGVVHDAPQAKRYGDLIESEGRRLTDMVEQVLEYAGLSDQRRPRVVHPSDAAAVVRDVVASSEGLFHAERVTIEVKSDDHVPPVAVDEGALRRALQNLLTNALKYGAGGQWVGVTVGTARARGAPEVRIAVQDRGRGIDAEDLAHVFEPFYRGRYAVDRQIQGNGLGLSLVKRIAEASGGRVTVESTPGQGATFTLHLPVADADGAVEATSSVIVTQ